MGSWFLSIAVSVIHWRGRERVPKVIASSAGNKKAGKGLSAHRNALWPSASLAVFEKIQQWWKEWGIRMWSSCGSSCTAQGQHWPWALPILGISLYWHRIHPKGRSPNSPPFQCLKPPLAETPGILSSEVSRLRSTVAEWQKACNKKC